MSVPDAVSLNGGNVDLPFKFLATKFKYLCTFFLFLFYVYVINNINRES